MDITEKLSILLINYEFPPVGGGAATASYQIARHLVRQGHRAVVFTSSFRDARGWQEEEGFQVYRCPTTRKSASHSTLPEMFTFVCSALLTLPKIMRAQAFDGAAVFFSIPCGPLGLWCRVLAHVPYIISLRGADVPGNEPGLRTMHALLRPIRRLVMRHSVAVVANSEGLKDLSEKADPHPVKVIHNGVESDFYVPPQRRCGEPRFLFVGRFREQKNLPFLLDQMNRLFQRTNTPFELHLVGDGPLKKDLMVRAAALEIRDRIHWHGWCDKLVLKRHFQAARALLNPSLYEGMPNVVLEAMACALPVVASNVIGNDAVVRNGETGFLFDLHKPEEFQEAVNALLSDRLMAHKMGDNARKWVEKSFSWDRVARAYVDLICAAPLSKKDRPT